MLRILAVALTLVAALPNTQAWCDAWCANQATEQTPCRHAGALDVAIGAGAPCGASVDSPSLHERFAKPAGSPRALLPAVPDNPPPVWVVTIASGPDALGRIHTPLRTVLRI